MEKGQRKGPSLKVMGSHGYTSDKGVVPAGLQVQNVLSRSQVQAVKQSVTLSASCTLPLIL